MDKKVIEKSRPSVWSPFANQILDEEELEIENAVTAGEYVPAPNQAERLKEWKRAAENYKKKKSVTVRIYERTLRDLKVKAMQEGIPYQTLLTSVLHKYVTGRLVERD
jgi:predicted DNA binding CopG/RHH family protein